MSKKKSLIGVSVTLRCHDNEYDDLLTLFHFSSSETFFLQYAYAKFQQQQKKQKKKKNSQINKLYFPLRLIDIFHE